MVNRRMYIITLSGVKELSGAQNLSGIPSGNYNVQEIQPIQYHGREAQIFTYTRIKIEDITIALLERLYELSGSKERIRLMENKQFFLVQYPNKPIILVNKGNGRLYAFEKNKETEHQATFVLRILKEYNLVEGVHSSTVILNEKKA